MTSSITRILQSMKISAKSVKDEIKTASSLTISSTTTISSSKDSSVAAAADCILNTLPIIPLSEVAMHDDYSDCWIVIYDRVYDVTNFLRSHPGGEDVIMDYAGRDATIAFNGTGHSNDATEMLKKYLIGELPQEERIFSAQSGGKYLLMGKQKWI